MVKTGAPAMAVVQSTTIMNSKILNIQDQLGQIALGFLADMV
ncbi:hypothetical protein [Aquimarina sp. 2201CG5-10]|nr:hypothetical protein [Aquimarina sp. 2201CG5-10]MDY8136559.1 hypothetical protein [Aquimarina sp. 2201CG5-10]